MPPHIILLYLIFASTFKKDHGYRIKLSGDEELYLVKIDKTMRLIKSSDLENRDDLTSVALLEFLGKDDEYTIKFSDLFLSAKSTDPGIIPIDYEDAFTDWKIQRSDNGFKIVNQGKCLVRMDANDKNGYYLNSQPCDSEYQKEFSLLDSGNIIFYCKNEVDRVCRAQNYNIGQPDYGTRNRPDQYRGPQTMRRKYDDDEGYGSEGYGSEGYGPERYKPERYGPEGYESEGYDEYPKLPGNSKTRRSPNGNWDRPDGPRRWDDRGGKGRPRSRNSDEDDRSQEKGNTHHPGITEHDAHHDPDDGHKN